MAGLARTEKREQRHPGSGHLGQPQFGHPRRRRAPRDRGRGSGRQRQPRAARTRPAAPGADQCDHPAGRHARCRRTRPCPLSPVPGRPLVPSGRPSESERSLTAPDRSQFRSSRSNVAASRRFADDNTDLIGAIVSEVPRLLGLPTALPLAGASTSLAALPARMTTVSPQAPCPRSATAISRMPRPYWQYLNVTVTRQQQSPPADR